MLPVKEILNELEKLVAQNSIDATPMALKTPQFRYEPLNDYIEALAYSTKPETATHDLFGSLVKDLINAKVFHEVNINPGFVDFYIRQSYGNPILVELKPCFKLNKADSTIDAENSLKWKISLEQVKKYLQNNEFVILSDLRDAYLFNVNSIITGEPFAHIKFTELLERFSESINIWDAIRRVEDSTVKIDLDKEFFEQLKEWYGKFKEVNIHHNAKLSKDELIVLLINKVIFIKTLEDYGLIDFHYLIDEYERYKDKWSNKGVKEVLTRFFAEIEDFFDKYYDTELFKTRFWENVDTDERNLKLFQDYFEAALGLGDKWYLVFNKGLVHYTYRHIDEDIFGKAYETFIAEQKKDSGIYYTPKEITTYMAHKLVVQLFDSIQKQLLLALDKDNPDFVSAYELLKQLHSIRIIDPTSGSGSFLIKVLREIYAVYQTIDRATQWVKDIPMDVLLHAPISYTKTKDFRDAMRFDDPLKLISNIILYHIFASDKDERALETAKTNIWKEAVKLNPRIYNFRDLKGDREHILPNLELNYASGDSLADLAIEKQLEILSAEFKNEITRLHEIRLAYIHNPYNPSIIEEALKIKLQLRERLKREIPEIDKPLFICAEFFFCYFDENGNPLPEAEQGFEGVISNPPWEAIKPIKKEFANQGKGDKDILDFDAWFERELNTNPQFNNDWESYRQSYENYNNFISRQYSYQGSGDPNYYKYFIERDLNLLRKSGMLVILVPSGIQTDLGSVDLRKLLLQKNTTLELTSFENKGYRKIIDGKEKRIVLFPDVHNQFKFSVIVAKKEKDVRKTKSFDARFYLLDPDELYTKEVIPYTFKMIEKFSPENLSIMEFNRSDDFLICTKVRGNHVLFADTGLKLIRELDMTNDSNLFNRISPKTKDIGTKNYILYEGKMIYQFESHYSAPRYYVSSKDAHERIEPKERFRIKRDLELENGDVDAINIKIDLNEYRLVYRTIGRSTDQLTIISSIIAPNVVVGHSMNYLKNYTYQNKNGKISQTVISRDELPFLMSLWNSLTLNYYIRNKVSANLTMNFINELPIAEASKKQKEKIVELGFTLLSLNDEKGEFNNLGKQLGVKVNPKADSIRVRAELEVLIARDLYGLTKKEWEYLTSTFIYGGDSESKQELDKIIALSKVMY